MTEREEAQRIADKVWEAPPRRLLELLIVVLLLFACIPLKGCGIVKPDPDYMYGPRQTFDKLERDGGKE